MQNQKTLENLYRLAYADEIKMAEESEEELYHHGVLGMRWGVRRYQPYPEGYTGPGEYKPVKKSFKERRTERKQRKIDDKKQKAISSLDIKAIRKHPEWYTSEELNPVVDKSNKIKTAAANIASARGEEFFKSSAIRNQKLSTIKNLALTITAGTVAVTNILQLKK